MIKTKKVSELSEAEIVSPYDLLSISQSQEDGSYVSKKISIVNLTSTIINVVDSNVFVPLNKTYTNTTYYLTNRDDYIRVEATNKGKYQLILPIATGSGKIYIIKNVSKKNSTYNTDIFLLTSENDVIEAEYTNYKIRFQECLHIIDGALGKWEIIGKV